MKRRVMMEFKCVRCGKTKGLKHKAFGKCVNCYHNDIYHAKKGVDKKSSKGK